MTLPSTSLDAYSPATVAQSVEKVGVIKAHNTFWKTLTLGVLAGAFIAFGGMFYTTVITGSADAVMPFGVARLLGGLAFSLGLILVVVAGAELFTGNNLIVMAWADRKISSKILLRNWLIVYIGNWVGASGCAVLYFLSGSWEMADGELANTIVNIATSKTVLPAGEAFVRGILCNIIVCLAVWMCFAARSVSDKVLAILFPISAFVALGFEHSIANMYLILIGMFVSNDPNYAHLAELSAPLLTVDGYLYNLLFVTLGNIVGGSLFVAATYYFVYIRVRP